MRRSIASLLSTGRCLLLAIWWSALLVAHQARGQIIINEVLANNATIAPIEEEPDYTPDYIELYNTSTNDIDLGLFNWSLVVEQDRTNYNFTPGTVIPADSYLLIFCDSDTNFAGIHTLFGLEGRGDTIILRRAELTTNGLTFITNDIAKFGLQLPDYAVGRVPDGGPPNTYFTNSATLIYPSPCGGALPCLPNAPVPFVTVTSSNATSLKINEWMALDTTGTGRDTNDWFEIYNPDTNIVLLSDMVFADRDTILGIALPFATPPVVPLSFIAPEGFVQFYANGGSDPDEADFSLSSTFGDDIYLFAPDRATIIDVVKFGPQRAPNIPRGRIPDGAEDQVELPNPTPRDSNFGRIDEILITEILTHTDPPLEDAVELHNPTANSVNIGGWWLSNQKNNPMKYRIPANTIVPAGGYTVLYEYQFNGPTAAQPFTFNSAHGDECWLFRTKPNGALSGFRRGISFGAAQNGVSFIRFITGDTNTEITAASTLSLGTSIVAGDPVAYLNEFRRGPGGPNGAPMVGPLVINEIHYRPPPLPPVPPDTNNVDNVLDEFIEIHNITDQSVRLYDPDVYRADRDYNNLPDGTSLRAGDVYADGRTNTWRVRGDVDFDFPADQIVIPPRGFLLVVNFDPGTNTAQLAIFRQKFPQLPLDVPIYGPYKGKLSNRSATVDLNRPDIPQGPQHPDFRFVPRILVDHVGYEDRAPWPSTPDGGFGDSLQRISPFAYGNDSVNWKGEFATPGRHNTPSGSDPVRILSHPLSRTVKLGGTATFSVSAAGSPPLRYQWQHGGVDMPNQTNATLRLVNINTDAAGLYNAVVSNEAGPVASREARLTVSAIEDRTRPTVTITKPSDKARMTNEALVVAGKASDKGGIDVVEYSLNNGSFLTATGSPTWSVWGSPTVLSMTPGTNVLAARSIDYSENISITNYRRFYYAVPHPILVTNYGEGTVTGVSNLQTIELGRHYTATPVPRPGHLLSNWIVLTNLLTDYVSTAPKLTFMTKSNLTLIANFVPNPFIAIKGAYNGLFHEADCVRSGSAGFFTLTLADRGAYSASLLIGLKRYSLSGQFDLDGAAHNVVTVSPGNQLHVTWRLDLNNSAGVISGTVSNALWTADLLGDRVQTYSTLSPAPHQGRYTLVIPGKPSSTTEPEGSGFGTAVIDRANVVKLAGTLADGTKLAQKVAVSREGKWPLYASLNSGRGVVLSWVNFSGNPGPGGFEGALCWTRVTGTTPKIYPGGFTNVTSILGSPFIPGSATNRILQLTDGVFTVVGGHLAESYTNTFTLGANHKITDGGPHKLALTFTTGTGLFSGSLTPLGTTTPVRFKGAVLQNQTNAAGFFLGPNRSGNVSLTPPLPETPPE